MRVRHRHTKYTKEQLSKLVTKSISVARVMKLLGFDYLGGGAQTYISKRIKAFGIDTSHFKGQAHNKNKISTVRLPAKQVLVFNRRKGVREPRFRLHRALHEIGVKYECALCYSLPTWQRKKLILPIDHINGNPLDCRKENLRYLCPNCHSQTETFGSK